VTATVRNHLATAANMVMLIWDSAMRSAERGPAGLRRERSGTGSRRLERYSVPPTRAAVLRFD
jgi:hypothetical protein